MKPKAGVLKKALPWIALVGAYILSVAIFALYGSHNLDADVASEMVLANLLNREGKIALTDSWAYSTELRVISPIPLYQLGLLLFSSWHMAHTFAVAIIVLVLALATLFMAREIGFGEGAPWLATMLVLPFSSTYAWIMVHGGFYSMHAACAFVLLGLVCRYGKKGLRRGLAEFVLIAVLSLLGGMGGVRMISMLIAPMFCAAMLLGFLQLKRDSALRDSAHTSAVRMAAAASVSLILAGAGYVYNEKVLAARFRFSSYGGAQIGKINLADYLAQLRGMLVDVGLRENVPLFSVQGIASMAVLGYFVLVVLSLRRLFKRWDEISLTQRFFLLTAVIAVLLGMTLVIALYQYLSRYFIIGTMMLMALPVLAWEAEPCRNALLRTGAFAALACLFLFQTSAFFRYDYRQGDVNYEMAADWLLEHGYTQGYATFWNANTMTQASDGKLDIWSLRPWGGDWVDLTLEPMLQEQAHFEQMPQGRIFLMVDEGEKTLDTPILDEAHLVDFIAWSYYVYEYDSVDEMLALLADWAQQ